MSYVEIFGWLGAFLTVVAYLMPTMLPLRMIAVLANVCTLTFAALASIYPVLFLHMILLPLNAYHLFRISLMLRRVRASRRGEVDIELLKPLLRSQKFKAGDYVFRKGDAPDNLYFLNNGKVRLEEIDVVLSAGEIFGEIAFFTNAKERTVSARCSDDCEIMKIDEAGFMRLYYQNPAFGFSIIQLVANRLLEGIQTNPEAYKSGTLGTIIDTEVSADLASIHHLR